MPMPTDDDLKLIICAMAFDFPYCLATDNLTENQKSIVNSLIYFAAYVIKIN